MCFFYGRPPLNINFALLYSTLLCKKLARSPGVGLKRSYMPTNLGGGVGVGTSRIEPKYIRKNNRYEFCTVPLRNCS